MDEAEGGGDGFLVRAATREIPEREVAGEDVGLCGRVGEGGRVTCVFKTQG